MPSGSEPSPLLPPAEKWSDGARLTLFFPQQQRNLNNAFAYDLVPSPSVVAAALKAARRVNDFATAVRIFEGMHSPLSPKSSQLCNVHPVSRLPQARAIFWMPCTIEPTL